jgi:hypothetical protein
VPAAWRLSPTSRPRWSRQRSSDLSAGTPPSSCSFKPKPMTASRSCAANGRSRNIHPEELQTAASAGAARRPATAHRRRAVGPPALRPRLRQGPPCPQPAPTRSPTRPARRLQSCVLEPLCNRATRLARRQSTGERAGQMGCAGSRRSNSGRPHPGDGVLGAVGGAQVPREGSRAGLMAARSMRQKMARNALSIRYALYRTDSGGVKRTSVSAGQRLPGGPGRT